jgi:hypothetical protein
VTDEASRPSGEAYERAGQQAAMAVRGYSSVLVVSDDPAEAAYVAIGVGRAEAVHRRVVIADLAGEVPPIQSLLPGVDLHGIYDSFVFGTSLDKVIYAVEGNENLNVLPSGTESAATEEILGSRRWRHIASDFAATDSLLLLVAAANAPGLDKLTKQLDGMVVVGNPLLGAAPDAILLARIPHPAPVAPSKRIVIPTAKPVWGWRGVPLAVGALLLIIIALFVVRPGGIARLGPTQAPDTVIIPDSQVHDSTPFPPRAIVLPANPADSAVAVAYSVEILAANTAEGANFELQRHGAMMPAATISLVPIGDTEAIWYKVFAGAFPDSAQAERLLASLRRRHVVPDSAGTVVRAPLALRVDSVPSQAAVASKTREKIRDYAARGLAVYALVQSDGSARLYAGAFENPEQSTLAATALRVAGLVPALEYRTGRVQ